MRLALALAALALPSFSLAADGGSPDGGKKASTATDLLDTLQREREGVYKERRTLDEAELEKWREGYERTVREALARTKHCKAGAADYGRCLCKVIETTTFPKPPRHGTYGVRYPASSTVDLVFKIAAGGKVKGCQAEIEAAP